MSTPTNTIDQLLATVRSLVTRQPDPAAKADPIKWLAVRYDHELGLLDATTLRQEPSTQANPAFIEQPLLFPWVYISTAPHYPVNTCFGRTPHDCIHWINSRLTFRIASKLDVKQLADIVSATGGHVFTDITDHQPPPAEVNHLRPSARPKALNVARHRSQPLRYTRQLRRGQQLADHADQLPATLSSGKPKTRYSAPATTVPEPILHRPGHLQLAEDYQLTRQEAEDELRNWLGIYTFAEEVVQALELKNEREFLHE